MTPKALVMDVDGTLVERTRLRITAEIIHRVETLKKRGVKIILASGRADFAMCPTVLNGFQADYYVCVNGSNVVDANKNILYENRFTMEQLTALWKFCENENYPIGLSFEDAYYAYVNYAQFSQYYIKNTGYDTFVKNGEDHVRHLRSMPFGAFACIPMDCAKRFTDANPDLRLVPYEPGNYDVYKTTTSKADGIEKLLKKLHLNWDEVAAIGDSYNDMEMIRSAGIGVAMGNGQDALKRVADFVTKSIEEAGVVYAIDQIFN